MNEVTMLDPYRLGTTVAALKVKEAFEALPPTADNATRDLLLDLYNDIMGVSSED